MLHKGEHGEPDLPASAVGGRLMYDLHLEHLRHLRCRALLLSFFLPLFKFTSLMTINSFQITYTILSRFTKSFSFVLFCFIFLSQKATLTCHRACALGAAENYSEHERQKAIYEERLREARGRIDEALNSANDVRTDRELISESNMRRIRQLESEQKALLVGQHHTHTPA